MVTINQGENWCDRGVDLERRGEVGMNWSEGYGRVALDLN
jgi:hypothetical protein